MDSISDPLKHCDLNLTLPTQNCFRVLIASYRKYDFEQIKVVILKAYRN
jgi:hypothetical protein